METRVYHVSILGKVPQTNLSIITASYDGLVVGGQNERGYAVRWTARSPQSDGHYQLIGQAGHGHCQARTESTISVMIC